MRKTQSNDFDLLIICIFLTLHEVILRNAAREVKKSGESFRGQKAKFPNNTPTFIMYTVFFLFNQVIAGTMELL